MTELKWPEGAIAEYFEVEVEERPSIRDLANRYGRSEVTVRKMISREAALRGIDLKATPRSRALHDQKTLGPLHIALGLKLVTHRVMDRHLGIREMAKELGVSPMTLGLMERGSHDYTLTQLLRLSEVLDVPVIELISDAIQSSNRKLVSKPRCDGSSIQTP